MKDDAVGEACKGNKADQRKACNISAVISGRMIPFQRLMCKLDDNIKMKGN
jgi:hypothetical protein